MVLGINFSSRFNLTHFLIFNMIPILCNPTKYNNGYNLLYFGKNREFPLKLAIYVDFELTLTLNREINNLY